MNSNDTILSTKRLTRSQTELILNAGIGIISFNILEITPHPWNQNEIDSDHIIITSSNAIQGLEQLDKTKIRLYCVGETTRAHLKRLDYQVVETANTGSELATIIIDNYASLAFNHLAGVFYRPEISSLLLAQNIALKTFNVYHSAMIKRPYRRTFAAVLCYSPRGVYAFAKANPEQSLYICIGETTATEARKYSNHVIVASKPTVENVIVTAIKTLIHDQK